ncbi:MAG TPA: hypothetical protein VER83_03720 [Candidatus Nanopelagicales bacterium]|nr:hypothetical protein [Candidatus Nanopelagicales bacterium]
MSLIATCILVVGCSSGGSGPAGAGASEGIPGSPSSGATDAPAAIGGLPAGHRPSGAKVRIVNAYAPLNGDPGPIDIHAAPWAAEGDTPLLSVPYGTVSEYFDPTVADDAGDMFLSVYWAGTTGNGNELISQTETLKGGEVITFIVTSGGNIQESGRRYGAIQAFFQEASGGTFGQATPEPGKALLVVDTNGVEQVLAEPDSTTWFFSAGSGCTKGIGDSADTLTGAGPGSAGTYQLDPGSYTGSIHAQAKDDSTFPTCDNGALIGNLAIQAVADQTAILLIYGTKDEDLRSLFIPLEG